MELLKNKIYSIMYGGREKNIFSFELMLRCISKIYEWITILRIKLYNIGILKIKKLDCLVISIGNISVGGTGKTPMTCWVASHLKSLGYKVVVLSRGYKGKYEKTGGIVCDGHSILMKPEEAGDEPYMMAENLEDIPVIVGRNRYESGMLAMNAFKPDIIILDDGFQHLALHRDINLVLMDDKKPFGNFYLLPRGILREPLISLKRSDAIILTRTESEEDSISRFKKEILSDKNLNKIYLDKPIFQSYNIPVIRKIISKGQLDSVNKTENIESFLTGKKMIGFSGIAQNNDFNRTIEKYTSHLVIFFEFQDHHEYSDKNLMQIHLSAKKSDVEYIVTTEKDFVRIKNRVRFPVDLVVIGININYRNDLFNHFIKEKVENLKRKTID